MSTINSYETDHFPTSAGELQITFLGHGSLLLRFDGKVIYTDPFSRVADYSGLPAADLVLLTHEHRDHLDPEALKYIVTSETQIVQNPSCAAQNPGGIVVKNGESCKAAGIPIEAVPAYNLVHKRPDGQPYHPRGVGNGYILTFGDLRVYIAGDTEDIAEMANLRNIAVAFLPMNLPFTMTPEMTASAARSIKPQILYPYHYGDTDTQKLIKLLQDEPGIEVRIRKLA